MFNQFRNFTKVTKSLIIAAFTLLLYGYLCRIAGIYFFWESKSAGWVLIFIAILSILIERIWVKKLQNKKVLFEKIFIGLTLFILVIKNLLLVALPRTNAYATAKQFLSADAKIKSQVRAVDGFFLMPLEGYSNFFRFSG